MSAPEAQQLDALWESQGSEWREPEQITSGWREAERIDRRLLRHRVTGRWWETLAELGVTLLVTREYEHLAMAMRATDSGPDVTFFPTPHPSGLAVDVANGVVHLASTRNPNQVFDLMPAGGTLPRSDAVIDPPRGRPLVPVRSRFYPCCFYLHDIALVGGVLHANSVGQNAIVRFASDGSGEAVWWPRSIETPEGPERSRNLLQLNSIAAGDDLASSFFSASAARPSARRPGHRNFAVDGRGVVFSGATREPVVGGLTRPHSARLHQGKLWVDNSGYGELVVADPGEARYRTVTRLPGWTRGLCFAGDIAFVGTSRVIPRFRQYAPGLDVDASRCGLHAVDTRTGRVLGSLTWPYGNQIFAVEWTPLELTSGFPFNALGRRATRREKMLFYAFETQTEERDR